MALTAADLGSGTTLTTAGTLETKLLNISWSGISRGSVETTLLATVQSGKSFVPEDNYDGGEVTFTGQLESTHDPFAATNGLFGSATEDTTLQIAVAGSTTLWSAAGAFLTGFDLGDLSEGEVVTFSATYKINGNITVTPGA